MSITTENTFETALVQSLTEQGGYTEGNAPDYSPVLGMFKYEVIIFYKILFSEIPHKHQVQDRQAIRKAQAVLPHFSNCVRTADTIQLDALQNAFKY